MGSWQSSVRHDGSPAAKTLSGAEGRAAGVHGLADRGRASLHGAEERRRPAGHRRRPQQQRAAATAASAATKVSLSIQYPSVDRYLKQRNREGGQQTAGRNKIKVLNVENYALKIYWTNYFNLHLNISLCSIYRFVELGEI